MNSGLLTVLATDAATATAIDAATNRVKDDKSADEWLPKRNPQTSGSSPRQVTIKIRYHLAVTQDEKDEMIRGLSSGLCDGSRLKPPPPSEFKAPESSPSASQNPARSPSQPSPKPTPKPDSEPKEDPEPYYENCAAVWAAGADPIHRGDPDYARHLDRDGDGVGCDRS